MLIYPQTAYFSNKRQSLFLGAELSFFSLSMASRERSEGNEGSFIWQVYSFHFISESCSALGPGWDPLKLQSFFSPFLTEMNEVL